MNKTIVIGSMNPVKFQAISDAFMKVFCPEGNLVGMHDFKKCDAPSNVSNQPKSYDEVKAGVNNRLSFIREKYPGADYFGTIEAGIIDDGTDMFEIGRIMVANKDSIAEVHTPSFWLPSKVSKLIREGNSQGKATDIVYGMENSKQNGSTIHKMTDGLIKRYDLYFLPAVIAFSQLKNHHLYK